MIKRIVMALIISLSGTIATNVWCQEVSISADITPKRAAVGQHMRLVVTVEGKANVKGSPGLPPMNDFQVYGGSRSSNFSFVNGKVSSALSFTYVLVPKRSGRFEIGPIKILHENKEFATAPIEVEITGTGPTTGGSQQQQQQLSNRQHQTSSEDIANNQKPVFVKTEVNRKTVYVNEPIILTFRFYTRVPLLSQPQYAAPETNGFWSEDLPPQQQYVTTIGGQEYTVIEIKTALFPTTSGKLTISPAHLTVAVQDFRRGTRDPFNDAFFRSFFSRQGQRIQLDSKPIAVTVKPVPNKNRPNNFTGTVGEWSMSAKLDRKEADVNDAVTLEVRVFGEGNVKSVGKPKLPTLPGFKVYETVSSSEVQKKNDKIRGVKIYRTLIRPQVTGELNIPEIKYSYFNPRRNRFETVKVPSLSLSVKQGPKVTTNSQQIMDSTQPAGQSVKVLTKDIRYLKTGFKLKESKELPMLWLWLAGFVLPPIIISALWIWRRHQDRLASDPRYARRLAAEKTARKVLHKAHIARTKKNTKEFYTALAQALSGYLADRMGVSRSGITHREIIIQLKERGVEKSKLQILTELFDECDFARFAPGERSDQEMVAHEQQASDLLMHLMKLLAQEKKG